MHYIILHLYAPLLFDEMCNIHNVLNFVFISPLPAHQLYGQWPAEPARQETFYITQLPARYACSVMPFKATACAPISVTVKWLNVTMHFSFGLKHQSLTCVMYWGGQAELTWDRKTSQSHLPFSHLKWSTGVWRWERDCFYSSVLGFYPQIRPPLVGNECFQMSLQAPAEKFFRRGSLILKRL